jgi:selenocysteine lyase/cysteine desulfurase
VKFFLQEVSKITDLDNLYFNFPEHLMMGVVQIPIKYNVKELKTILTKQYKIEVPVIEWNNRLMIRISVQVYNSKKDVEHFIEILKKLFI